MTKHGRARLTGRGRTAAALAVVGLFYGTATFALTSTDSTPDAAPTADAQQVVLVGATRTGPSQNPWPPGSRWQDVCRFLPGFPYCSPRTVTKTVTQPASTVTNTVTQPASTVTTTITQPATTVVSTVTAPGNTVTKTETKTVTQPASTVTTTKTNTITVNNTETKTVTTGAATVTKYITKTVTVVPNP